MKIEEMERITKEATPGPWHCGYYYKGKKQPGDYFDTYVSTDDDLFIGSGEYDSILSKEDASFLVMARNKMEKLLAVARWAKEVDEMLSLSRGWTIDGFRKALEELEKEE